MSTNGCTDSCCLICKISSDASVEIALHQPRHLVDAKDVFIAKHRWGGNGLHEGSAQRDSLTSTLQLRHPSAGAEGRASADEIGYRSRVSSLSGRLFIVLLLHPPLHFSFSTTKSPNDTS
ncbi:unnamed protein product [Microthlaspi erraticum]|uniref:Uncharacterized protein n=1 Tax=Microthlaspi erraticum TaxID=1685480 RepID=A0A6D2JQK0_9BRAS|nr:unnamed protein product [Microthlaspi erraticum]